MQKTLSSWFGVALCAGSLMLVGCGDDSGPASAAAPSDAPSIQSMSMGWGVPCAIRTDGSVRCWGPEKYQKDWDQSKRPVTGPLKHLIVNGTYSCALNQSGSVYCWGRGSGINSLGRGGLPDPGDSETPVAVLSNVSQLDDANGTVCALTNDGDVYCWGEGVGDRPTKTTGLPKIKQVSVGLAHRCAVGVDSSLWCWGRFEDGSDGTGRNTEFRSDKPFRVDIPFGGATQVSAGAYTTCAVSVDSASVFCWGRNNYGQIGNNAKGNNALTPQKALLADGEMARQVSVGSDHACAMLTSGGARCWGHIDGGVLGNGEGGVSGSQERYEAKPVMVKNGQGEFFGFKGLVTTREGMSGYATRCGWGDGNQAWCWGHGNNGQLGDGNHGADVYANTPKKVQATESGWQ